MTDVEMKIQIIILRGVTECPDSCSNPSRTHTMLVLRGRLATDSIARRVDELGDPLYP